MSVDGKYEVLKFYIRNLSVESPLTGRLPHQINQPNIDIDIDPRITQIADNLYEVAARFTVSARANNFQLYLVELIQAGLFSISPSGEAHKEELLRRVFPQLLYPAARSNLVNFIVVAGYQPIVLEHIQLENLFTNTPLVDKRPSQAAPVLAEQAEPVEQAQQTELVAPSLEFELPAPRKHFSPRALVFAGAGIIVLLLALRVDFQQYLASFFAGNEDHPADTQVAISSGMVTSHPETTGSVSAVAQNEVSGLPVSQLVQTGSNWLAAQEEGAFTVELLRTDDLKKMESMVPPDEGQPLFLVKLHGAENTGYAVLSGTYGNEGLAKQAAAKFSGYRAMRFSDYR